MRPRDRKRTRRPLKLRLVLDVEYEPGCESPRTLRALLEYIPIHVTNEGFLTGETDAEVAPWSSRVVTVRPAHRAGG